MATHACDNCRKEFYRRDKLVEHQIHCQGNPLKRGREEDDINPTPKKVRVDSQIGESKPDSQVEEENDNPCSFTSAFEDSLKKIELNPRKDQKQGMPHFLRGKTKPILNQLSKELIEKRGIKWFISVKVRFVKPKPDGEDQATELQFRSLCMKTVNQHELENQLDEATRPEHSPVYPCKRIQLYSSSLQAKDQESYNQRKKYGEQVFHVVGPRSSSPCLSTCIQTKPLQGI
jgi:hypothetical protein